MLLPDPLNPSTHSDAAILAEHRHQHLVEGSSGSRWLKGLAQITSILLEKPQRIAALGLVFLLARMVRDDLQLTVRR